jgi:tetratricopeptide (TPR) repeat protein
LVRGHPELRGRQPRLAPRGLGPARGPGVALPLARRAAVGLLALALGCAAAPPPERPALREGEADLATGDYGAAAAAFQAALELRPDLPEALVGLAQARLGGGDAEAALGPLRRLRRIQSEGTAQALHCRALAAAIPSRLEGQEAALDLAEEAERLGCAGATMRSALGAAYLDAARRSRHGGRAAEALERYRAAGRADPGLVAAFAGAAELLLDAGRPAEARSLLAGALERHPDDEQLKALMVAALGIRYPGRSAGTAEESGGAGDGR